ncbi:MAG: aminomethyl-transferring glycine dehydrogenase subunit GcvPB [Planctomycetota bacterium]|jgi:glycine dehydrogenase subunit 2
MAGEEKKKSGAKALKNPRRPEPSKLVFERSRPGRTGFHLSALDVPERKDLVPEKLLRAEPAPLPEVSEPELVRHYTVLSQKNFSIDTHFYPLGSCTMKHNPRINEKVASMPSFARLHPLQPEASVQGILELMHELERHLAEIAGFDATSLQPAAGAHGELTGMMLIKAHLDAQGQGERDEVLIPDSAHGTNPATCTMCRFKSVSVKSAANGSVDMENLKKKLSRKTAGLMITNPSTLGLFEEQIVAICGLVHEAGGQVYMDGANLNAIMGRTRPGDFGIDVMHFNLHKTFSTPHGGGGPGSGPVACRRHLEPFLPVPRIRKENGRFRLDSGHPQSIGHVKAFYGNAAMLIRAYAYIRIHGAEGLARVSDHSVLNANYLKQRLRRVYPLPYDRTCMHEFVLSATKWKKKGVRTLDIAKRLLDYGFHPPTVYFPLTVPECLMIEPTETENRETLDAFARTLLRIAKEARETPEIVKSAPHVTPVRRLDEVTAARQPVLRYTSSE